MAQQKRCAVQVVFLLAFLVGFPIPEQSLVELSNVHQPASIVRIRHHARSIELYRTTRHPFLFESSVRTVMESSVTSSGETIVTADTDDSRVPFAMAMHEHSHVMMRARSRRTIPSVSFLLFPPRNTSSKNSISDSVRVGQVGWSVAPKPTRTLVLLI